MAEHSICRSFPRRDPNENIPSAGPFFALQEEQVGNVALLGGEVLMMERCQAFRGRVRFVMRVCYEGHGLWMIVT